MTDGCLCVCFVQETNSFKAEVIAGADVLKYLLGRGGAKVRKVKLFKQSAFNINKLFVNTCALEMFGKTFEIFDSICSRKDFSLCS